MDESAILAAPPQESRGDKRRRELVEAACRLIAEKGFEGLRVRDVAAAAGVNIATLHYYFPEKEDLIRGVIEQILQQFMSANASIVQNKELRAADRLRGFIANLENRVQNQSEICIVITEITSRAHRDASIHEILAKVEAKWRARLAGLISAGHVDGSISLTTDPEITATILTAMFRGLTVQAVYHLDQPNFSKIADLVGRWIGPPENNRQE